VNDDTELSFEPVKSYDEATHAAAAAIDTVIAEINGEIAKERSYIQHHERQIERAEKNGLDPQKFYDSISHGRSVIARLDAKVAPFHDLYSEHRWSRFFLVLNSNGHIHRDTSCSTCFITTEFGWLPQLSGLTEADAVADQGEILCSVCFPSAPVEWTNGTSNNDKAAKAERAALKADRHAKKVAKALVPDDIDGGLTFVLEWVNDKPRNERLKTIAAAKAWLTDYFDWNAAYPRTWEDGTVVHHHPSYPPSALEIVADVYAARIGSTPEAEIEAAKKRAAKRR
jgi:hypothetical protein